MELCSFWVISPADGQDGKPEPIKLIFYEEGDITLISLCADPDFWGAYRLPSGSYSYSGKTLTVNEENFHEIRPLVSQTEDVIEFRSELFSAGLVNDSEWQMFYDEPRAWKSLRMVAVTFGNDSGTVGEDNE